MGKRNSTTSEPKINPYTRDECRLCYTQKYRTADIYGHLAPGGIERRILDRLTQAIAAMIEEALLESYCLESQFDSEFVCINSPRRKLSTSSSVAVKP